MLQHVGGGRVIDHGPAFAAWGSLRRGATLEDATPVVPLVIIHKTHEHPETCKDGHPGPWRLTTSNGWCCRICARRVDNEAKRAIRRAMGITSRPRYEGPQPDRICKRGHRDDWRPDGRSWACRTCKRGDRS